MIINAPLRHNISPDTWGLIDCRFICNGGTFTEDPLNYAKDSHLAILGQNGYKMVYSTCLARSISEELDELARYISHGIDIVAVRIGNEDYNSVKIPGVRPSEAYARGRLEADKYINHAMTHYLAFHGAGYETIFNAPFPSNQQDERFTLFRQGWCDEIHDLPLHIGVDMHVYDRCRPVPINFDLMPEFEGRKRWFIETGALYEGDPVLFLERSERVFTEMRKRVKGTDVLGFQLMENDNGLAFLFNGIVTELGEFHQQQDWSRVTRVIDRLPFVPNRFLIVQLEDPMERRSEVSWNGWSKGVPALGSYL